MIEIKYGLFCSFLLFVWLIIEYTLLIPNFHGFGFFLGMAAIIIPLFGIYLGIKEKRDKTNFGYINFRDAFRTGIAITFIIAVMVVLFIYVYYEYVNPGYVNFLAAETEKALIQRNVSRDLINAELEIVKYQFSLNVQLIQQLLFVLIGGTAITFIFSTLLKKVKKRHPEGQ